MPPRSPTRVQRIDTTITVETPERVGFRFRIAGPGQRGLAWGLDAVIQLLLALGLGAILLVAGSSTDPLAGLTQGALLVAVFSLAWGYGALFEWAWHGRTPGKLVLGLRVVRGDGSPIGLREAVLRNLLRGVDGLPFANGVGAVVTLIDPRMRRIGDLVADTVVVVEQPVELLSEVEISRPVAEEERQLLPAGVRLSRRERRVIEGLLRRREDLAHARVEELAALVAPGISERTGVRAPTSLRVLELAWARAAES